MGRGERERGWWPVRLAGGLLALVLAAVACGGGGPSAEEAAVGSQVVHFESADGVRLEGRLFGDGPVGVVLSHMFPADQRSWFDFAGILADEGFRSLTYNFRGYCPGGVGGCSEGEQDIANIWQDVLGAIAFLESQGVRQVMLVGASMGGTASLIAAAQDGIEVGAVITLSAPARFEGLVADASLIQRVLEPKLFVAGAGDSTAADAAQGFYRDASSPKRVEIVPSNDHGSDLVTGSQAEVVRGLILRFLNQFSR